MRTDGQREMEADAAKVVFAESGSEEMKAGAMSV